LTLLFTITTAVLLAPTSVPFDGLAEALRSRRQPVNAETQGPAPLAPQTPPQPSGTTGDAPSEVLRLQVMLDRAGFSPGAIDGRMGANTKRALALYQEHGGTGGESGVEPLTTYTVTPEDAAGPFVPQIPRDLVEQATLPALAYTSVLEALAERFHSTPALLQQLNPRAQFAAGEAITVPNVEPLTIPAQKAEIAAGGEAAAKKEEAPKQPNPAAQRPDVVVTVSQSSSALTVADSSGRVIFHAPVTTGSERDPLPIGEWKVNGVQFNPTFNYNPDLFWDADPAHTKAKIPSGPNNPVGLVWIDLSKEHYGIHGTPEPSAIGRTESHGCVRLTNWDAVKLAGLVKPGTRVVFTN
jgi:lipoprotein-anchoring transpeptidase ErfK/SrfK